jgi:NTP pyrophosphatase (non-canonical NTP hydrolase)
MEIREFQDMIREIFYENDRKRGVEATMLWLVEEVGELAESLRKGKGIGEEMADVFAWLVSLANLLDINLEEEVKKKYPNRCSRCHKNPCGCGV